MFKLIKLFFVFFALTLGTANADLSDILKKGEVKIAVPEAFAPFGAVGKSGEHEGYDVDVAKLVAKDLGVKLTIVPVVSKQRIPFLETDKVDLVISVMGANPQRAKSINFSRAYAPFFSGVFASSKLKISSYEDLDGLKIGVTGGTLEDLELTDWANSHKISPHKVAIKLYQNTTVVNSADYGSIQARKRVISGEIIKKKKLIIPAKTHRNSKNEGNLPVYRSINLIKSNFPIPYEKKSTGKIKDINYDISISKDEITDHFYDAGVYEVEWKFSKFWKQNHPYMGRMSFPENNDNPSRTITATKIANSRESIIYKSEIRRKGNGEFRLPTVREAAIIMGFPLTYQFLGSENTKWRLVGNAVCCAVSRALAKTVLDTLKLSKPKNLIVLKTPNLEGVKNLNTYKRKKFNNPPTKKKGARFRRHPIKDGNLTVTLSNYDIDENSKTKNKWFTSIQYGTGEGFPIQKVKDGYFEEIEDLIKEFKSGKKFLNIINNGFTVRIGTKLELQEMYEKQVPINNLEQPF